MIDVDKEHFSTPYNVFYNVNCANCQWCPSERERVLKCVSCPPQGNQIDIVQQKHIRSINGWDGTTSKDGRYGLFAPSTGGMEMIDLRSGKVCKTLIPKVAEGIFDVLAVFNATNEFVLYYHSGRKTIRAFRKKDGQMIANFRVQADLKGMETTTDGK